VLAPRFDAKLNPSSAPENWPVERAGANVPRNAAGSVAGTVLPEPSCTGAPVASHSILKLTVDGTKNAFANWNVSMTGNSLASKIARLPLGLMRKAPWGSSTVQKSPDRRMPPTLS
jgi:hypothetical protein